MPFGRYSLVLVYPFDFDGSIPLISAVLEQHVHSSNLITIEALFRAQRRSSSHITQDGPT